MAEKFNAYSPGNLAGDIGGAASSAVVNVLQSLGYGLIAFAILGPEYIGIGASLGLLSAITGCLMASVTGGTGIIISGPQAPLTMIVASVTVSLAASSRLANGTAIDTASILAMVSICILVAAVFQILVGGFRLGGVVKFIPYPVMSGFMNGVALLIILGQTSPLLGLPNATPLLDVMLDPGLIQPMTLLVGVTTLVSIYLTRRFVKWIPGALVGVVAGSALYHLLRLQIPDAELGPILELSSFSWSTVTEGLSRWDSVLQIQGLGTLLPTLLVTGLIIGLISSMETLMSSAMADNLLGRRHDSNRDLIGQGLGNLCCGVMGCLPSGGSMLRTMVNYQAGGRTRLSAFASGVFVLAIALFLEDALSMVPLSVIAGMIVSIGIDLFDNWTKNLFRKLHTHVRQRGHVLVDLGVTTLVAVLTVSVNIVVAVGIGIAFASLIFMARTGRSVVRRKYSGDHVHSRKIRTHEQQERLQQHASSIVIYELQGSVFFGSADRFAYEVEQMGDEVCYVIIDLHRVTEIDSTGANILVRVAKHVREAGGYFLISHLHSHQSTWQFLEMMDVVNEIGSGFFFADTDLALEWAEDHILANQGAPSDADQHAMLAEMDIMESMHEEEIELLESLLVAETCRQGDVVFREGDMDRDLYIVLRGKVSIIKQMTGSASPKRLVTFSQGSVFGEMSLIDENPRSADAWADEDCHLLRLPFNAYRRLCSDEPTVAIKLLSNIGKEVSFKLRRTSHSLATLESA